MLRTLGSISIDHFLANYWQQQPLLLRQLVPNPDPGLDANDLAGLALEDEVESRIVHRRLQHLPWQVEHGPFTEQYFAELPETDWTLLVQGIDHWVPACADLLSLFRFIPNWRLDDIMASFAVKGGSVGPHYDQYDVFLLQTHGQRRWRTGPKYDHSAECLADTPLRILKDFKVANDWTLEPGDCLYLPPGFGHYGEALNDCITLSIGFRAPGFDELISSLADYWCGQECNHIQLADELKKPQANPGEISSSTLQRIRQQLQHQLNDSAAFAGWFGEYMTAPKHDAIVQALDAEEQIGSAETEAYLNKPDTIWRWNDGSRFTYSVVDPTQHADSRPTTANPEEYFGQQSKASKRLVLSVDGENHYLSATSLHWVQILCLNNVIANEPLKNLTLGNKDELAILTHLINRGSLQILCSEKP